MKNRIRSVFFYLIFPLLFLFLLLKIDTQKAFHLLAHVHLPFIIYGQILTPIEISIRAAKLKMIVSNLTNCPFFCALKANVIGIPFDLTTPGGIGGFIRLYVLRKYTTLNTISCFNAVAMDRMLNFGCLLFLSAVFFFTAAVKKSSNNVNMMLCLAICCVILILLMLILTLRRTPFQHLPTHARFFYVLSRILQGKVAKKVQKLLYDFRALACAMMSAKKQGAIIVALSYLSWLIVLTKGYIYLRALSITTSFVYFILLYPAVILITMLPISILGLGTRDIAFVLLLSLLSIDREHAMSLSMLFHLLQIPLLVCGLLVGLREYYKHINQ